jgi:hypothetical protein
MEDSKPRAAEIPPPRISQKEREDYKSVIERAQKIVQKSRDRVRQSRATQKSAKELIAARPRRRRE